MNYAANIPDEEIQDLFQTTGDLDTSEASGYCSQSGNKWYTDWEQEVAKPALEKLGFTEINFIDGERDSFGPLSRIACAYKNGDTSKRFYFVYG